MAVETIHQFRTGHDGQAVQPVILTMKRASDGEIIVAETNDNGELPVAITIDKTGLATEAKQDAGNTKLDTLHSDNTTTQGKIDSTNTKLDTLHSDNTTTQGKVDSTNTKLDTLHSDNTTTQGKIDSTNTKLDTLHTDIGTTIHNDLGTLATNSEQWPYAAWNAITYAWDAGTFTETYTWKTGGAGGTPVGTTILVYTDATKATLASVTKSPATKVGG